MKAGGATLAFARSAHLHSNMDRFESRPPPRPPAVAVNLHSNMDRFERCRPPSVPAGEPHLHSNMDRFERSVARQRADEELEIYIPIWIDLKEPPPAVRPPARTDLHSNMDRFESEVLRSARLRSAHLHSNMDRFERSLIVHRIYLTKKIYIPIWIDLKGCSNS